MNGMPIFTILARFITASNIFGVKVCHYSIKNLLLRGCYLRNIDYCVGIAIYVGPESKIMKNAKKPPKKVSNIMI
jgi:magnesium-transporting ATPase (P-type)